MESTISKAAAELGRRGGAVGSEAQKAAARENGRKGGRPSRVEQVDHGKRTVMGTDWPVYSTIDRLPNRKGFLVTFNICNGTSDGNRRFRTLREAREALQ